MIKAWIYTVLGSGGLAFATFGSNVILARELGPEGRGGVAAALLIVSLCSGVAQCGLGQSFAFKSRLRRDWELVKVFKFSAVFIAIIAALLVITSNTIKPIFDRNELVWITIFSATSAITTFVIAIAQAGENLRAFNTIRLISPITQIFCFTGLVFINTISIKNVIQAYVLISIFSAVISILWAKKFICDITRPKSTEINPIRSEYLSLAVKYHLTGILGLVITNVDKVYLLFVSETKQLGFYVIAFGTSRLVGIAQEAVSTALFSRLAGTIKQETSQKVIQAFKLTFFPMLIFALILSVFSESLLVSIFGSAFKEAAIPFSILTFESVFAGAGWILAQQFNATGRPGILLFRQIITMIPLFLALPYIPGENSVIWLALLLLSTTLLRLIITITLFNYTEKTTIFELIPNRRDFLEFSSLIGSKART